MGAYPKGPGETHVAAPVYAEEDFDWLYSVRIEYRSQRDTSGYSL